MPVWKVEAHHLQLKKLNLKVFNFQIRENCQLHKQIIDFLKYVYLHGAFP